MPNHQHTPHKKSKAQLWAKRTVHLKTYLQDLPRRLRLDVEALVKIFLTRRSLLLKLADNYLIKLWECSRSTVQRRLEKLEELGLLKRLTQPPRKQGERWNHVSNLQGTGRSLAGMCIWAPHRCPGDVRNDL